MCDFYIMEQPISCHEWSWHQFQRNKSKKETNQVSLPVYKVRIGTTTTGLQTSFVSEDTSLQHLSRLAFNYKLTMTTTWELCFIFKYILPQRPTQVLQRDLFIKKHPLLHLKGGRMMSWSGLGAGQHWPRVPAPTPFCFVILGILQKK